MVSRRVLHLVTRSWLRSVPRLCFPFEPRSAGPSRPFAGTTPQSAGKRRVSAWRARASRSCGSAGSSRCSPVQRASAPGGSSNPPTSFCGTSDPVAVALHEVAAHLEVPLPLERRAVLVHHEARGAGMDRHADGARRRAGRAVRCDPRRSGPGPRTGSRRARRSRGRRSSSGRRARPSAGPTRAPRPRAGPAHERLLVVAGAHLLHVGVEQLGLGGHVAVGHT